MAMSSLSADIRPRAISTPTRTPIGKVNVKIPGSVHREQNPERGSRSRMANDQIHQSHKDRHEKYECEDSQTQQSVGENLAANVSVD